MHRTLLSGVRGRERAPGEFRRMQVQIGADARYVPPPANDIERSLDDFEKFLNEAEDIEPLLRTFIAHYQFEAIHPFFDGNGRVGRALLTLCAYKWCSLLKPWLYMSPFFDRHKEEYIDRLFAISTDGAWQSWFEFCLRGVIEVCTDAISRCDRLRSLRDDYHRRADRTSGRMHQLVEMLFSNPIIRIADAARRLDVTYPTAKTDVAQLAQLAILEELPGTYPKAYVAWDVFHAAYDESLVPERLT
jgi:Fic family protein